jgi:putative nucleotidyltransferase with HDIG domain
VIYLAALIVAVLSLGIWLVLQSYGVGPLPVLISLALIGALGERGTVRFSPTLEFSISVLPTLFAAVTFGPLAGMLISAATMLGDFRSPYLKWGIYSASRSLTGALAGLAAGLGATLSVNPLGSVVSATLAGAITAEMLDTGFACLTIRLRRTERPLEIFRTAARAQLTSAPLYISVVAVLAYAYEQLSPWTLVLFFIPTLAAQRLFALYQEQRRLAENLAVANDQLERASVSFAGALVAALDERDQYTAGHSAIVAVYARDIAERMGLTASEQDLAQRAGLLHDIGKVGLPAGILEKPGPLSLAERGVMEEHSRIGERMLVNVPGYEEIAWIVRHHHERVDGCGYPDGLAGDEIPVLSRIIGVADAYNAMTSGRPYRDAMPTQVARQRLAQAAGSQFDEAVVAAFETILTAASEAYRSGTEGEFAGDPLSQCGMAQSSAA